MTQNLPTKHLVIYADDDRDDTDLVTEAFEKYAHNVKLVTFQDGGSALSYLRELSVLDPAPCLIILDINMPVLDGKEVLKKLREMEKFDSTPILLFTTSSQPMDKAFASEYRAGFITKPLSYAQMDSITELFIEHCADDIRKEISRKFP